MCSRLKKLYYERTKFHKYIYYLLLIIYFLLFFIFLI